MTLAICLQIAVAVEIPDRRGGAQCAFYDHLPFRERCVYM